MLEASQLPSPLLEASQLPSPLLEASLEAVAMKAIPQPRRPRQEWSQRSRAGVARSSAFVRGCSARAAWLRREHVTCETGAERSLHYESRRAPVRGARTATVVGYRYGSSHHNLIDRQANAAPRAAAPPGARERPWHGRGHRLSLLRRCLFASSSTSGRRGRRRVSACGAGVACARRCVVGRAVADFLRGLPAIRLYRRAAAKLAAGAHGTLPATCRECKDRCRGGAAPQREALG